MKRAVTLLLVVCFFTGCTVFGIRTVEDRRYTVEVQDGNIEIRQYADYIVAQTAVEAGYNESSSLAFKRLAGYIFGGNKKKQDIAMTAPVLQQTDGEKIAMTAPVLQDKSGEKWVMSFIMPAQFTLETLPIPLDPDIEIRQISAKKVATIRYSGILTEENMAEKAEELMIWLAENDYKPRSAPRSAGYDPPWTIPFLRRNEVHIDIE